MNATPFCGLPEACRVYRDACIVVLPVPFDKTGTWIKGADKGPWAILEASPHLEFYDIETGTEVYRRGIFTGAEVIADTSLSMIEAVAKRVGTFLANGKFVVTLGGEHSVSIGAVQAHAGRFGPISVLHLDAHSDRRDEYEGSRYNHACAIARISEIAKDVVSVGIRSMDVSELASIDKSKVFFAAGLCQAKDWASSVVDQLSENVYVTIDLDVFDPAIVPSTGTPEPGGLGWYDVLTLLKAVTQSRNVVGFDVVELCPSDTNKAPDFLAAKLVYTFLSYIFAVRPQLRA